MSIGNPHGYPDYTWPMVWVLQDGELWPIEQWVAKQGVEKHWVLDTTQAAGTESYSNLYTVPVGKVLYIVNFMFSSTQPGIFQVDSTGVPGVMAFAYHLASSPVFADIRPPAVNGPASTIRVWKKNTGGVNASIAAVVRGFEMTS